MIYPYALAGRMGVSMEEPSVLDYFKSKLTPWKSKPVVIPDILSESGQRLDLVEEGNPTTQAFSALAEPSAAIRPAARAGWRAIAWPWKSLVALLLALVAQRSLEPHPDRTWTLGVILYSFAAVWLVWAIWSEEWKIVSLPVEEHRSDSLMVNLFSFVIATALALIAFVAFGGNRFTVFNLFIWILAIIFYIRTFWLPEPFLMPWYVRLRTFLTRPRWRITISRQTLLVLAAIGLVIFFRYYRLNQVPPEMFSDHAEKLLDVSDVLHGITRIFFPRNTGREAIQMYLTAAISLVFGTGLSFTSLKIGTITAGVLALPYIYLLGKEVGSSRVGLIAAVFAGIAYWPNVISRVGLRFPLYPLFAAPTLYYLLRGLRTANRNDFILSGIALGIGLHGYSPTRILPVVVLAVVAIYLIHHRARGIRQQTIFNFLLLGVFSLVLFLPLLRYALENPDMFFYRTLTRMGTAERSLPGPVGQIFLHNLWNALTMFFWSNGEIWVHSVPYRPALDVVSASLFFLGCLILLVRYLQRRHWLDLFLLVSVPLLMLPSILSFAFPNENPSLNRTGGAVVTVFLILAIALDGLITALETRKGKAMAWGFALVLLGFSSFQNYDLVFNQYFQQFRQNVWNTSEMGEVIRDFSGSIGSSDTAWVVPYPYWVDTRLVSINAGLFGKELALWPDQFESTLANPDAKLFLIKPDDIEDVHTLQQMYPQGVLREYTSQIPNWNFLMFFVPPQK
jgi:hypothetical protein